MDETQLIALLVLVGIAALQYLIGRFLSAPLQGILPVAYTAFAIWAWFQQDLGLKHALVLGLGLFFLIRFGVSGMNARKKTSATN